MPHNRAVASFDPMAKTCLPKIVRFMTTAINAASATAIHTPCGRGKKSAGLSRAMMALTAESSGADTVCLLDNHFAAPRTTPIMPSVTMNGSMRNPAMMEPLSNPIAPPAAITAATAHAGWTPATSSRAPSTLVNATTDPTLRSMPPLTITSVMPSAPIATMTVCVRTTLKFAPVKMNGRASSLSASRPSTNIKPRNGPRTSSQRRRIPGTAPGVIAWELIVL